MGDGEEDGGLGVIGAEHHFAVFEEFGAGVKFVDARAGETVLPDFEANFSGEAWEWCESFAEFVGYSCAEGGGWFRWWRREDWEERLDVGRWEGRVFGVEAFRHVEGMRVW